MKIPVGNFGNVGIQPQQAVLQRADTQVADATQKLGSTVESIAVDQMAAQTRLDLERKSTEERTAAARVRMTTVNDHEDLIESVGRGVVDGTIPKDKAVETYNQRSSELLKDRTTGLAPDLGGMLGIEFEGMGRKGLNRITDAVSKRDQQDTGANLMALGEEYQRLATRDRPRAVAEYFAQIDALGPKAGMTPEQIQKTKQGFREQTDYTNAFALVRGSSGNMDQIKAAKKALADGKFADMDPQKSAQLTAQLDGYETTLLQRQEIAAQRAARQEEARLNKARAAFEVGQRLIESGVPLAPDQYDQLAQTTSGTPYAQGLRSLQQDALVVGGAGAQPIGVQRAQLDALNTQIAQGGITEGLAKRRDLLQKVVDGSMAGIKEDPLRAGLQRGVITDIPPLDMTSMQGMTKSIAGRLQAAQVVQAWAGQPVSPLTADESQQLAKMITMMPVEQRSTALAALGTTLGPQASAGLAKQLDPKDKALALALQYQSTRTTNDRYTSEIILRGDQALKDKSLKVDTDREAGWRTTITKEVGDAYPNQNQRNDVIEAAYLINAGMAAEGKPNPKQAVKLAARGGIVDLNGRRVPVAPGLDEGDLENRLRTVTPQEFAGQAPDGRVKVGGQEVGLDVFIKSLPSAQLMHARQGAYYVLQGNRVVTNTENKPLIVKVGPDAR